MLIEPVPYDPEWPALFERRRDRLRAVFAGTGVEISHIGSTAVPGLRAKPIIDIQIGAPDLARLDPSRLSEAGFDFAPEIDADDAPPGADDAPHLWRKLYARQTENGVRAAHLHIREIGRPNHRFALLFRDFLRADAMAAAQYGAFKASASTIAAAASDPGGSGAYLDLKDSVVLLIARLAEAWAAETGWRPRGD